MASDFALLYNDEGGDYYDVIRLDLTTNDDFELRVENPIHSMQLSDSEQYAVAILRPEDSWGSGLSQYADSHWGLAVINARPDNPDDDPEAVSLVLEAQPIGVEIIENESSGETFALVMLEGIDSVFELNLDRPSAFEEVDLVAPSRYRRPTQRCRVLHHPRCHAGLVSFYNPATKEAQIAHGFAATELIDDDTLPNRDGDED